MKSTMKAVAMVALGLCAQKSMAAKMIHVCEAQCVAVNQSSKVVHQLGPMIGTGKDSMQAFQELSDQCRYLAQKQVGATETILAKRLSYREAHASEGESERSEWREALQENESILRRGSHQASSYMRRSTWFREGAVQVDRYFFSNDLSMEVEYATRRDKDTCTRETVDSDWVPSAVTGPNGPWG